MVFFILVSFGFIGYRRLTIGLSQETKNLLQLFKKKFQNSENLLLLKLTEWAKSQYLRGLPCSFWETSDRTELKNILSTLKKIRNNSEFCV